MAITLNVEFKDLEKELVKVVREKIIKKIKSGRQRMLQSIIRIVEQSVIKHQGFFIPNDAEAGELGIQADPQKHGIDEQKRSGAWKALLPSDKESAFSITINDTGQLRGELFSIRLGWSRDKFYNASRSIVKVFDLASGDSLVIPWMQWFVEGKVIQGHSFRRSIRRVSRTGKGIMIKGGVWQFAPTNAATFVGAGRSTQVGLEKEVVEDIRITLDKEFSRGVFT